MRNCGLHNITVTARSNTLIITLISQKVTVGYTTLLLLREVIH